MPSDVAISVKAALNNFVSQKTADGEIAIDVLRSIRDEAALLMERQTIWDTFDIDPLKFFDGDDALRKQVERIKNLMTVISCSRCTTKDGYSTIEAVIEFAKDARMKDVKESFRLTFQFQREKVFQDDDNHITAEEKEDDDDRTSASVTSKRSTALERKQDSPTHLTYDIDFSVDHGEKKKLLSVEVFAQNDFPSTEPAEPMEGNFVDDDESESESEGEGEDMIHDDGDNNKANKESGEKTETMSLEDKGDNGGDRYHAFVDPEHIEQFLDVSGLLFNAENTLFFLMTFPYFEHEWDIFGFLLDCVFGQDEDGDDDEYEDMSDSDGEA